MLPFGAAATWDHLWESHQRQVSPSLSGIREVGSRGTSWSSTAPASSLLKAGLHSGSSTPLSTTMRCRERPDQPPGCTWAPGILSLSRSVCVWGVGVSSFPLASCNRGKSKWSPLSLQACFLQLYEPSVPLVISSHICSFTMLKTALITRFAVSSWILFRGKKNAHTHLQEAAVTLEKGM